MTVLPPYARALGIVPADGVHDQAAAGALLMMDYADPLLGRPGFLHGGAIAGLLEMAGHECLRRALTVSDAPLPQIKPINVTVDFMRGGRITTTYAAADIVRLGARIANINAVAWQTSRDRPIAGARLTLLLDR